MFNPNHCIFKTRWPDPGPFGDSSWMVVPFLGHPALRHTKLIHLTRHPAKCIASNKRTLFDEPDNNPWYDFAKVYAADAWTMWWRWKEMIENTKQLSIAEVRLEDFAIEATAMNILEDLHYFLGKPWDLSKAYRVWNETRQDINHRVPIQPVDVPEHLLRESGYGMVSERSGSA